MSKLRMKHTITLLALVLATSAFAQGPAQESSTLERAFEKDSFSPYASRNYPSMVLWGDTHVRTALSMDGGAFGNRLGPEDAYRYHG